MKRVEGPQTPYESYCFSCRVTFPVDARHCVHCGGRLARRAPGAAEGAALGLPGVLGGAEPEEVPDEEGALFTLRRFGGLLIWTLVAASALLSNLCERS